MSRGVTNTFTQTQTHLCDIKMHLISLYIKLLSNHEFSGHDGPVFMILVMFPNSEERRPVSVRGARGSRL